MEGKPKPKPPSAFPHRDQRGVSAGADQLSREEAIRYFQEAVRRCEDENIVDAVLMKQAEAGLAVFLPEQVQACPHGCGPTLPSSAMQAHTGNECPRRPVPCRLENCGMLVRADMLKHHEEVERELIDAMGTWNAPRIRKALRFASNHCPGCLLQADRLSSVQKELWALERRLSGLNKS